MIRKLLNIVSLGLLLYLLFVNFWQIDIAATINNGKARGEKMKIDQIYHIDTVRQVAKGLVDQNRRNFQSHSVQAIVNFWVIVGLLLIQLVLVKLRRGNGNRV